MVEAHETLMEMIENTNDNNLLRGMAKFCERVKKYKHQKSRISSALHTFASTSNTSLRITASASLKRARKGKIYVQPEAVKRRKTDDGSRKSTIKGMSVKKNPFSKGEPQTKRPHNFAVNVSKNQAVSKKAGRTMASKTKFLAKQNRGKNEL